MFESILYKVLQRHLAEYLLNFDLANLKLGVWSGNITCENVAINPKLLNFFALPIMLLNSKIGSMRLLIPWNRLSSRPVELILENVLVVLGPVQKNEWRLNKDIVGEIVFEKLALINKIEQEFMKKLLKKQGKETDQSKTTYWERLTRLILDNLQIKVRNVHIRFECSDFAFGLQLDFLSMVTANEEGKEHFIDRNEPTNREKPVNKLINLENFKGYWTLGKENEEKNRLFCINAQARFTQNLNNQNYSLPEKIVGLNIKEVDFCVSKTQIQQMVRFVEFLAGYARFQKQKQNEKEKAIRSEIIDENEEQQNYEVFQKFFTRLHEQKEPLTQDEKKAYHQIIFSTSNQTLHTWTKHVLKDIKKKAFLTEQETRENPGWFSSWFSARNTDLLSDDEKHEFLEFIEETVKDEDHFSVTKKNPSDYEYLQVECRLEGGSLLIFQEIEIDQQIGIRFGYRNLGFKMRKSKVSQKIETNLDDIFIDMVRIGKGVTMKCEFLNRGDLCKVPEKFVSVCYQSFKNNLETSGDLSIKVSSTKIIYNPQMVKILKDFFDLKVEDQELKETALEKLHEIGDKTQATLEESLKLRNLMRIELHVSSPAIIVPFLHNNALSNECWVLKSGDLSILLDPDMISPMKNEEIYQLKLQQIKLEYFASVKLAMESYCLPSLKPSKFSDSFCLIEEFEIEANLRRSVLSTTLIPQNNLEQPPIFTLEVSLPALALNLDHRIYIKLLDIKNHVSVSEENSMEIVHNERIALLAKAVKIGEVYKKQSLIGVSNWAKFYCVLSGNYIYFFVNQKDLNPHSNFYLKKAEIFEAEDKIKGNNVLLLRSKTSDLLLAFDKNEQKTAWLQTFSDFFSKVSDNSQLPIFKKQASLIKNPQELNFIRPKIIFKFAIPEISLNLKDSNNDVFDLPDSQEFITLKAARLRFEGQIKQSSLAFSATLSSLSLKDGQRRDFLRHNIEENAEEMITITLNSIGYEHPEYKGVNLETTLQLGVIEMNYTKDTMSKLLYFFAVSDESLKAPFQRPVLVSALPDKSPRKLESFESMASSQHFSEITKKSNSVLLKAEVILKGIQINFLEDQLKFLERECFVVSLKKVSLNLKHQGEEINLLGALGNLQVFDRMRSVEVLGLGQEKCSLCEVEFRSKQNGEKSLKVSFNSIKLDLLRPILQEMVEYLARNFAGLVKKRNSSTVGQGEQAKKTIGITSIFVNLENPIIIIRPDCENYTDYLQLNLGKIRLQRNIMNIREEKGQVQEEKIELFMQDIDILISNEGVKEDLLKPFTLNLMANVKENSVNIKALASNLILNIKKSTIVFLMSLCEQNLLKNPQETREFNEFYEEIQIQQAKVVSKVLSIKLQFSFESINFFLIEELNDVQLLIPVCLFMFRNLRAVYTKNLNKTSFDFIGKSLIGSYFILRTKAEQRFLEEYSLLGQISRKKTYNIEGRAEKFDFMSLNQELKSATLKPKDFEITFEDEKLANFRLVFEANAMNANLAIKFSGLQINLMLEILMKVYRIFEFLGSSSKKSVSNQERNTLSNEKPKEQKKKNFNFKAEFVDCCSSLSVYDNYLLKMLGEISIEISKITDPVKIQQEVSVDLRQFELFICEMEEQYLHPLDTNKKRAIFLPFDLHVSIVTGILPANREKSHTVCIRLENFMAEISYKDMLILQKTFKSQVELLIKLLQEKAGKPIKNQQHKDNEHHHVFLDFKAKSLHILLINDVQNFFAPFLYFKLKACEVIFMKSLEKANIEASFGFQVNYYNFFASCWEPVVENISLKVIFNREKLNKSISIKQSDPHALLNINISSQMIDLLLKTKDLIKKDQKIVHETLDSGKEEAKLPMESSLVKNKSKKLLIAEHRVASESEKKQKNRLSIQISPSVSFDQANLSNTFDEPSSGLISRHAIRNMTGVKLEIEVLHSQSPQKLLLNHGQTSNIFLESAMNYKELFTGEKSFEIREFTGSLQKEVKIRVSIPSEKAGWRRFSSIQELSLDRVAARKNSIYHLVNPNSQLAILSKVNLHSRTNTKVLTLASPTILRNMSRKNLEIKLLSQKSDPISINLTVKLEHGGEFVVPVYLVGTVFVFRVEDDKNWSGQLSLESLLGTRQLETAMVIKVGFGTMISLISENSLDFPLWQKTLTFHPCFSVRNCLPFPLELSFFFNGFSQSDDYHIFQEESLPFYVPKEETELKISGKEFCWTEKFNLSALDSWNVEEKQAGIARIRLILKETSGNELLIWMGLGTNGVEYIFYPEVLIYNNSPFDLKLLGKNSEEDIIEKQTIKAEEMLGSFAERLELNSGGRDVVLSEFSVQSVEVDLGKEEKVDVIVETKALKYEELTSAVLVVLTGKFVIINECGEKIFYKQTEYAIFELGVKERKVLTWNKANPKKTVSFSVSGSDFSGFFNFTELGVYYFTLRNQFKQKKSFKVQTVLRNSLILISLSEIREEIEKPYLLSNEISNFIEIFYKQKGLTDNFYEVIKPYEEKFYLPDRPDLPSTLSLILRDVRTNKSIHEFELDLLKSDEHMIIGPELFVERSFTERQRLFSFKSREFEEEKDEEKISQVMEVHFNYLGLSFISNTGGISKPPYELCYFLIRDLEFMVVGDEVSRIFQLFLGDLRWENTGPSRLHFPLVLVRTKEKQGPILNIQIEEKKTKAKKLLYLDGFNMQLDDVTVTLEKPFIQLFVEYIKEIKGLFNKYKENRNVESEDLSFPFNLLNKHNVVYWQTIPFSVSANNLYLRELSIDPVTLKISYKTTPQPQISSLKTFFKALQNIDNASLPLTGLRLTDYFDDKSTLLTKILYKYKEELTLNSFKLLGSVEILGNPIGLFNHISAGFSDLIEKPLEGLNKGGALNAGKGLITGVSSLMRNTLTGTFNSVDKISSSFGSGLAALSFDQDYMKKKQARSVEAENVVEGLGQATNSLYKGLENGITGIFLNPLEGAKEEGVSGLLKGTFYGITGFFIKPISAIFDATSKTAIGLKNTVNVEENMKKSGIRFKRPFYGVEKFYKEYRRDDGEFMEFLQKFKKGRYSKLSFFDFVQVPHAEEQSDKIMLIMVEMILMLSLRKRKRVWEIETRNIRRIDGVKDGVLILLKEKIKKVEDDQVKIPIQNEDFKTFLLKTLKAVLEMSKSLY